MSYVYIYYENCDASWADNMIVSMYGVYSCMICGGDEFVIC